jgi:hypothetical protein
MRSAGSTSTAPRVFGRAGGSLVGATWAVNDAVARVGRQAELRTARVLDGLASRPDGPTVLHDLAIPIPNISANIDHVVVSGRRVLIIDSKGWRPARYWSLGRMAFRGWRRFGHANGSTPRIAVDGLNRYFKGRGVRALLVTPVGVVWPSSDRGRLSVALLGMDGCRVIRGPQLARAVRRSIRLRPANPDIVEALRRLLNAPSGRSPRRVPAAQRHR